MRKVIIANFIILVLCGFTFAQAKPFEIFDQAVKEQRGGFSGNKANLSTVFNKERIRLSKNFEVELWKYLDKDVDKYYWISFFLTSKSYLHGNTPLDDLAFNIRQKAIELLEKKTDKSSLGKKVTILRKLAITSKQFEKTDLAQKYKSDAELLLSENDLGAYITGLNKYDKCIYANIENKIIICEQEKNESQLPKEIVISGGIVNGRAISLPNPASFEEAKKIGVFGRVQVRILIDIDGNVISAEAISGPTELYKVSEDAALKAKFNPTKLSGKLVKVSGVIIYNFAQ